MGGLQLLNFIINAGGVPSISQGADADKPFTAATGALYCADDTTTIYYYTGTAWAVLVSGADTGAYIRNSNLPQNPGVYNIVGSGEIVAGSTDPNVNTFAQYLYNTMQWVAASPGAGSLFTAMQGVNNQTFNASFTLPNSATIAASFYRLILTGAANATITIANAGTRKRAMAAQVANVYLPATTFTDNVTSVAGMLIQSVYQDAGTAKSVTIDTYYALLIQQVDEQLRYAAITNKFAIFQDGQQDKNYFAGLLQFANPFITNSAGAGNFFLQADSVGNVSSVAAYTFGSLASYTGTPIFTGTTAPSGTTNLSYRYSIVGNLVSVEVTLIYATPGVAVTQVLIPLPAGLPSPVPPTGNLAGAGNPTSSGTYFSQIVAGAYSNVGTCVLNSNKQIQLVFSPIALLSVQAKMTYFIS